MDDPDNGLLDDGGRSEEGKASSQHGGGDGKSVKSEDDDHVSDHTNSKHQQPKRKSTRATRFRFKSSIRGKSRRALTKKTPIKSPSAVVTPVTSNYVWYKGVYLQVGDIVSVVDEEDGQVYYAQLRGFLTDQYCEKSAALTWLLPTQESPDDGTFDPATYILGPEEDIPRKLEYMEFVMNAPSDYFKSRSPFPTQSQRGGYLWTRIGPKVEFPIQSDSSLTTTLEETSR